MFEEGFLSTIFLQLGIGKCQKVIVSSLETDWVDIKDKNLHLDVSLRYNNFRQQNVNGVMRK